MSQIILYLDYSIIIEYVIINILLIYTLKTLISICFFYVKLKSWLLIMVVYLQALFSIALIPHSYYLMFAWFFSNHS